MARITPKMFNKVVAELKRTTDFLEGISILTGPQAEAFTNQQNDRVAKARKVIKLAKQKTPKAEKPRIVVYVDGGVVQGAKANINIDVEVFDVDAKEQDPELLSKDGESPDLDAMYDEQTKGLKAVY